MFCKCGRTMRWTLRRNFMHPQETYGRVYHCPECLKQRKDCDCSYTNFRLNKDGTIGNRKIKLDVEDMEHKELAFDDNDGN